MPTNPPATSAAPWQARPVFISSTFADMQAERSHLATHVFPRLEEKLRERRHQFEPIDLRLGVDTVSLPDEHARELQVLKVCLEEIERSRPFLIVLLGDRYGWVPAPERMQTAARERGFNTDLQGKSITALEIEFGLMKKDAQQRQRSFIYLRDALPYAQMPPELAGAYSDEFASDDGARDRVYQLQALKARLRADPELQSRIHPYHAEWDGKAQRVTGLDAWGEQVFQHLWAELDAETGSYASAAPQTWQQQERAALQEFVDQRRRDFIGREALLGQLLGIVHAPAAAEGQQPTTPWGACVTGGSGAGKSALMAELCARLGNEPGLLVLANAAGATAQGSDPDAMLRRFIDELAAALGTGNPLPDNAKPEEVETTFASLLGQVSQRQRVVLLLDALNQFEPTPRGQQLTWLRTKHWPANARLIATALPDAPGAAVLGQAQGVVTVALPALAEHDIGELAKRVWARYHRSINPEVVQALKAQQLPNGQATAGNPLWLTLALEQLNLLDADDFERAQKSYPGHTPAEKLHALLLDTVKLMPPDVPGLYGALLEYTEKAYGQAHARAFAVLIALGRFGWRETDLLPLVPAVARLLFPDRQVPPLDDMGLAVLRRGFRAHLVRRGAAGQLDFFHVQMREAVQRRALGDAALVTRCHSAIASHLEGLPVGDPLRDAELMGHLIGADEPLRAATLYADLPDPSAALAGATQALFRHLTQSMPAESEAALGWVAALPGQAGLAPKQTAGICNRFNFDLSDALADKSTLHVRERVVMCASEALERLARADPGNAGWQRDLSVSHIKIGDILQAQGDLAGALKAFGAGMEIAERLARADPGNAGWQRDLVVSHMKLYAVASAGSQASLARWHRAQCLRVMLSMQRAGMYLDAALSGLLSQLEASGISVGEADAAEPAHLAMPAGASNGDGAASPPKPPDPAPEGGGQEALVANRKALAIAEALAARDPANLEWQRDLSVSHFNLAQTLVRQGDHEAASASYTAAAEAARLAGARDVLAASVTMGARISFHTGAYDAAAPMLDELAGLAREQNDAALLREAVGNRGVIHRLRGEHEAALARFAEEEALCRQLDDGKELAGNLANQAMVLGDGLGKRAEALAKAEEAVRVASAPGLEQTLAEVQPVRDRLRIAE